MSRVQPELARAARLLTEVETRLAACQELPDGSAANGDVPVRPHSASRCCHRARRRELLRMLDSAQSCVDGSVLGTAGAPACRLRALLAKIEKLRGTVELTIGSTAKAVRHLERSLDLLDSPRIRMQLAAALEARREPALAFAAYAECAGLAMSPEIQAQARHATTRLRSCMVFGGWFVGSWRVLGLLAGLGVAGLLVGLARQDLHLMSVTILCLGGAGVYWAAGFRSHARRISSRR